MDMQALNRAIERAFAQTEGDSGIAELLACMGEELGCKRISIFEEILTTLHAGNGIEDLRYASSLLHHFLASMRYLSQFRCAKPGVGVDIVEQAIHYMRENIEQHIAMDDVLRYIGYSQSHFSAMFKRKMGMSPISYFNRLKIEHACHLLKTTDLRMNQICYKVGIDDSLYFSRLFSKVMGISPTQYKESLAPD